MLVVVGDGLVNPLLRELIAPPLPDERERIAHEIRDVQDAEGALVVALAHQCGRVNAIRSGAEVNQFASLLAELRHQHSTIEASLASLKPYVRRRGLRGLLAGLTDREAREYEDQRATLQCQIEPLAKQIHETDDWLVLLRTDPALAARRNTEFVAEAEREVAKNRSRQRELVGRLGELALLGS